MKLTFISVLCALPFLALKAQEKIYTPTYTINGKILGIKNNQVTYQSITNPDHPYTISVDQVLFAFNKLGNFLVPSKFSTDTSFVNAYFSGVPGNAAADRVYTARSRYSGVYEKADETSIYIKNKDGVETPIDKREVVLVIFKNGTHKLYVSDMNAVEKTLERYQSDIIPFDEDEAKSAAAAPPPKVEVIQTKAAIADTAKSSSPAPPDNAAPAADVIASNKDIEEKVMSKVKELSGYLTTLCKKDADNDQSNQAIDLACGLFINENATVEVSSVNTALKNIYKIRDYLVKVSRLKYDRVTIEWTNIQYVSDLKLAPDGTYQGTVTFEQEFAGYKDNIKVYSDRTRKSGIIILKAYKKNENGRQTTKWDVLLSDIGVESTNRT